MRPSLMALALLAAGWAASIFLLVQGFTSTTTLLVLATLLLAEVLSGILCAMAPHQGSASRKGTDTLGLMLTGWVLLCLLVLPLFHFRVFALFLGQPIAVLCLLAMTLLLSLLKLRTPSVMGNGRMLIFAATLKAALTFGVAEADLLLAGAVLIQLALLMVLMMRGNNAVVEGKADTAGQLPHGSVVLAQYADVLVLPVILSGPPALIYLVARLLGISVTAILAVLCRQSEVPLKQAKDRSDRAGFVTMAARLNLGVLLIGGGLCLAMLTAGPFVASVSGLDETSLRAVLMFILLGSAAPVFFGATDSLLETTGRMVPLLLCNIALIMGLWLATLSGQMQTALFLAQCFAVAHLLKGAISAVILARFGGVWPGLTALLLRQIKLM